MILKRSQHDPNTITKRSQNDPNTLKHQPETIPKLVKNVNNWNRCRVILGCMHSNIPRKIWNGCSLKCRICIWEVHLNTDYFIVPSPVSAFPGNSETGAGSFYPYMDFRSSWKFWNQCRLILPLPGFQRFLEILKYGPRQEHKLFVSFRPQAEGRPEMGGLGGRSPPTGRPEADWKWGVWGGGAPPGKKLKLLYCRRNSAWPRKTSAADVSMPSNANKRTVEISAGPPMCSLLHIPTSWDHHCTIAWFNKIWVAPLIFVGKMCNFWVRCWDLAHDFHVPISVFSLSMRFCQHTFLEITTLLIGRSVWPHFKKILPVDYE